MTSHVRQLVRSIHYRAFDFGAKDALCHKSIDIRRHSKKPMHNASRCKGALTELSPEFSNKGREQKKKRHTLVLQELRTCPLQLIIMSIILYVYIRL
jgi:hypothetical protein